jgi:hypothetical protein
MNRYLALFAVLSIGACARHQFPQPPTHGEAMSEACAADRICHARAAQLEDRREATARMQAASVRPETEGERARAALDEKNAATYRSQSRWETVEADNGAIYKVDLGHIEVIGRGVSAQVVKDEGDEVVPYAITFDCNGHYIMANSGWQFAPPRSVIGRIAALACAAKVADRERPVVPAPSQTDNHPTVDRWLGSGQYDIDVNSIKRSPTSATATVRKDGTVATLIFDCHGHFQDASDTSIIQIAPAGSIAGSVADTVCATSRQTAQDR